MGQIVWRVGTCLYFYSQQQEKPPTFLKSQLTASSAPNPENEIIWKQNWATKINRCSLNKYIKIRESFGYTFHKKTVWWEEGEFRMMEQKW